MKTKFEDDRILWNHFRNGDKEAYTYIYQKYVYHLLSYGLQFTTDRELIKDCVQDVFIKLYTYRNNLSPHKIKIYLLISMRNRISTLLTQKPVQHESLHILQDPLMPSDSSSEEVFIRNESSKILQEQVHAALRQLSLHQREIVHYRFMDGLTMEQISELMDMNIQSAYNLLHRAIKKLRDILSESKG